LLCNEINDTLMSSYTRIYPSFGSRGFTEGEESQRDSQPFEEVLLNPGYHRMNEVEGGIVDNEYHRMNEIVGGVVSATFTRLQ